MTAHFDCFIQYVRNVQRQKFKDRVSEEVRSNLRSYYRKKKITKADFKELMCKCVDKASILIHPRKFITDEVCHNHVRTCMFANADSCSQSW